MFFGQIHSYLTYLYHFSFSSFGMDGRFLYLVMVAYFLYDIFHCDRLAFTTAYSFSYNSFSQIQIDITLEDNGLCQK